MELELERNMQNLPFFVLRPSDVSESEMPSELANEPYAFIDDGARPEITRPRPKFQYEIINGDVTCFVGSDIDRLKVEWSGHARPAPNATYADPIKASTNISVVAVYDTYGLSVAYAYLRHLYNRKYNASYPAWLYVYLEGSLLVLRSEFRTTDELRNSGTAYILYLCSLLLSELSILDAKQPRMQGLLQNVDSSVLPPEVLAQILRSQRVAKPITSQVRAENTRQAREIAQIERCLSPLTYDELLAASDGYGTYFNADTGSYILRGRMEFWSLGRAGDTFGLIRGQRAPQPSENEQLRAVSLGTYERAFEKRGCDVDKSMRDFLLRVLDNYRVVTDDNLEDALANIVQLSSDTTAGRPGSFVGVDEVSVEIRRLIEAAIAMY